MATSGTAGVAAAGIVDHALIRLRERSTKALWPHRRPLLNRPKRRRYPRPRQNKQRLPNRRPETLRANGAAGTVVRIPEGPVR
jgi:hypothetical protein